MQEQSSSASGAARPKLEPLRSSRQFRAVYDRGAKFHTPFFSLFVLKTNQSAPRVGITVTRKIGSAVVRNRCKRRLREIMRRQTGRILGGCGCDIVVNVKPGLLAADFAQLDAAYARALERAVDLLGRGREDRARREAGRETETDEKSGDHPPALL